ncbi:hypothetical protein [Propionivibrio sp.]|uniref:hypothetical protein n=1 Tax=Propionivibrio sp. TaxID=2212460 RepID=UPI003BF0ED02
MANKPKLPVQNGLFEGGITCPDVQNLPWIIDHRGIDTVEVRVPGSVFQPVLLKPHQQNIEVGPGKLDAHEEQFVRDLVNYLYPHGGQPWSEQTPLKWGDSEIWLKRNIEKRKDSFCLRVDDSDWFYPDFILWILDHKTKTQTFGFVDPKGMIIGAGKGWADYKIVCTLYMPHVLERQLAESNQQVEYQGETWKFRVRGALVSTAPFASLVAQGKFRVLDNSDTMVAPTQEEFRRGRIAFQKQGDTSYIKDTLDLLTTDSVLDDLLARTALLFDRNHTYFTPQSESDYDLLIRKDNLRDTDSESAFVQNIVEAYLKQKDASAANAIISKRCRQQLVHYAKEGGILGFGAEKAHELRDHPTPAEELWKRKENQPQK